MESFVHVFKYISAKIFGKNESVHESVTSSNPKWMFYLPQLLTQFGQGFTQRFCRIGISEMIDFGKIVDRFSPYAYYNYLYM